MREIKFRAWDKKEKRWHSDVFIHIDGRVNSRELGINFKTANDFELMQYTGLKDKNGVEIYEGDILRAASIEGANLEVFWRLDFGVIDRSIRGAQWRMTDLPDRVENVLHDHEVISNIYEKPELVEVEQ